MSPFYAFRFQQKSGEKTSIDVLMVFVATGALDPAIFGTLIEREIETNLIPDEVLIVVRDPSFDATSDALMADSENISTLNRLGDWTAVTLVGYDHLGSESRRSQIRGAVPQKKIVFEDFRRRGVSSIFAARRGFVEATETYHFENPSGRHTERFIRLSNILARGAEIAFLGFCTLPHIPEDATVAYLDTPSLYAVIAAINEQRSSFRANTILADNFSSYGGYKDYRFDRIGEAFVLISGSSSGSLAADLQSEVGFDRARITHLLFLGKDKSGSQIVCDLRHCEKRNPEGVANAPAVELAASCRMCAAGSKAIKLKGDQFEFAGPQQDPLLIKKDFAPPGLEALIERIAGQGVFKVGSGPTRTDLPKQFEVDPEALLKSRAFRERLDYGIRRSVPANLGYVIALDAQSKKLASKVQKRAPNAKLLNRGQLDTIPANTISAIAVVAAVIESGRSLLDVSRDLRSIAPKTPILYLVGFSKSTGENRRETLGRSLTQTKNPYPYEIIEFEKMILPSSSGRNPWADELALFTDPDVDLLIPASLRAEISDRVDRLRQTSKALDDQLFLPNSSDRALKLQPGFVFWSEKKAKSTHSQADVYFTIASVLQRLRANSQKISSAASIKSNWFQQTILAAGNFGRFNDDIIQASILRSAYAYEMNYADSVAESQELGRLIRRIIQSAETPRGGAAAEFLLALATRRLRICENDLNSILNISAKNSPMVSFLQNVCRSIL